MVDIDHQVSYIEASGLLTQPEVLEQNAFCTIKYLSPVKSNTSNIFFQGPVAWGNSGKLIFRHVSVFQNLLSSSFSIRQLKAGLKSVPFSA